MLFIINKYNYLWFLNKMMIINNIIYKYTTLCRTKATFRIFN